MGLGLSSFVPADGRCGHTKTCKHTHSLTLAGLSHGNWCFISSTALPKTQEKPPRWCHACLEECVCAFVKLADMYAFIFFKNQRQIDSDISNDNKLERFSFFGVCSLCGKSVRDRSRLDGEQSDVKKKKDDIKQTWQVETSTRRKSRGRGGRRRRVEMKEK